MQPEMVNHQQLETLMRCVSGSMRPEATTLRCLWACVAAVARKSRDIQDS